MRIVLLSGDTFEVEIDPCDMWSVYKLVREGHMEAFLKHHDRAVNVRKIARETFEDIILDNYRESMVPHDTEPPKTLPTGEMAVVHR